MNIVRSSIRRAAAALADLSPTCRSATRLATASLDRPLPWRQRLGLRLHLVLCRYCRRFAGQIQFVRHGLLRRAGELPLTPAARLPAGRRAQIKESLRPPLFKGGKP